MKNGNSNHRIIPGIKIASFFAVLAIAVVCLGMTAFAASRKPVKSVSITAKCSIKAGSEEDSDDGISIKASGEGYELDSYELTNGMFEWEGGEIPEVIVYINAKDGYYFNVTKASQIKLKGCKYKKAERLSNATTLAVTIVFDEIERVIGEVEEANLTEEGLCTWAPLDGAGSYEVRFLRESSCQGGTQTVQGTSLDCGKYLTRGGTYKFRVRAVHEADPNVKGKWCESPEIVISREKAQEYREAAEAAESAGDWIQDGRGWRFRLPDGTFVGNAWRKINQKWYYFLPDTYMATGWNQVGNAWYYLDPETGEMWANNTTPDGHMVDLDGKRVD